MAKHRALIVGAGRIGAGYNWAPTPFLYTHADAYLALKDRVELVGFVEPDTARRMASMTKYGIPSWADLAEALAVTTPDVVSICTQPDQRGAVFDACLRAGVRAFWCEKPLATRLAHVPDNVYVNVNYWRRFDAPHQRVAEKLKRGAYGRVLGMTVAGKRDEATVCHMTDLALWWGVPKDNFAYCDVRTPGYVELSYYLYCEKAVVACQEGGMLLFTYEAPIRSRWFPGHDIMRGNAFDQRLTKPCFMETALGNLLDAMEGKAALLSPPENAIKAEEWADEILRHGHPLGWKENA